MHVSDTAAAGAIPVIDWNQAIGFRRAFFGNPIENLDRLGQAVGDIGQFQLASQVFVVLNAPALVDEVLVKQADAFHSHSDGNSTWIGKGVTGSEGETHRQLRKLVAPAYAQRRIAGFAGWMGDYAQQAQAAWPDGGQIDIACAMTRLSLRIIGRIVCGWDSEMPPNAWHRDHAAIVRLVQQGAQARLPSPAAAWRGHRLRRATVRFNDILYQMIRERRASGDERPDLLDLLLGSRFEDGTEMTDEQIHTELLTPLVGDFQTIASALTWAWFLLTRHPDAYARLREEADAVLAGRVPGYEDLASLPYTAQVFKEAMRLYPPLPILMRTAQRDVEIGGYPIPQGAQVRIHPYLLHRRPDLFPEPERFAPDRFAPDEEKKWPRHAYMPFGGGPRLCLGNHLALIAGTLTLATLAQRVEFSPVEGRSVVPDLRIVLYPRGGIRLRVRRRGPHAPKAV